MFEAMPTGSVIQIAVCIGLTALVAKGAHVALDCPGGSHVFDLDLLRSAGFLTPGK